MSYSPDSETSILQTTINIPADNGEARYVLEKSYSDIANSVNLREIAIYDLTENQNGQQWFIYGDNLRKRFGYRKCFSQITAGAVTTIAHGIADITSCRITRISGTMQNSPFTTAIPLPQSGANPVSISIGAANITLNDSTAAYVGYTAYIIVEFVRDR